jgi:hypothetical protein
VDTWDVQGMHWFAYSDDKGYFCIEGLDGVGKDVFDVLFRAESFHPITITNVPLHTKNMKVIVP